LVVRFAPRVDPRLLAVIMRLDDGSRSYAEICRRVGRHAAKTGLSQPSYERVRTLVRHARAVRPPPRGSVVLRLQFEASIGRRSGLKLGLELGATGREPPWPKLPPGS
jgi:hypothetical protein